MLTGGEHGLLFMGRGGRDSIYLGRVVKDLEIQQEEETSIQAMDDVSS
jgi:hypothetical protein